MVADLLHSIGNGDGSLSGAATEVLDVCPSRRKKDLGFSIGSGGVVLKNFSSAFEYVQKALGKKYTTHFSIRRLHKGRHVLLEPERQSDPSFYCLYKREYFITFNKQFPEFVSLYPDLAGVGESINEDALTKAIMRRAAYLLFVYENGRMYVCEPHKFLRVAQRYKLFRNQQKLNRVAEPFTRKQRFMREGTYSLPLKLLTNVNEVKV